MKIEFCQYCEKKAPCFHTGSEYLCEGCQTILEEVDEVIIFNKLIEAEQ